MGNAESQIVKNMDKRTARREHAGHFRGAVQRWRTAHGESREAAVGSALDNLHTGGTRVCVRKRPIFPHETAQGEFDVISTAGVTDGGGAGVLIHDARMQADMIHMYVDHHMFKFDAVFGDECSNDDVYLATTRPLVRAVAQEGLHATVMMYGQTGSGKTYTMSALQRSAFRDLFADTGGSPVALSFVELLGDRCCDMLNGGAAAQLISAPDGSAHPYPCVEVPVTNAEDLGVLIRHANSLRATAATGVHDSSSRSHALCRVFCPGGGQLTLVDLAGSEHRIDSDEHNAERRKEGAMINASLAALKDCVRAHASGQSFINYRNNRLTQLLRGCFAEPPPPRPKPCTVLIATVSPSSKDTEHSLNTLRHACIMDGQGSGSAGGSSHITGGSTVREDLGGIDVPQLARERFKQRKKQKAAGVPPSSSAPPPRAAPAHQGKESNVGARAKLDRHGVDRLPPELRSALLAARDPVALREAARLRRSNCGEGGAPRCERAPGAAAPPAAPADPSAADDSGMPPARRARRTPSVSSELAPCHADAPRPGGTPAPAASPPAPAAVPEADGQREQAFHLWRLLRHNGRNCRCWRSSELRLIAVHVIPTIPPHLRPQQLEWRQVELALDELVSVAEAIPADHACQGEAAATGGPAAPGEGAHAATGAAGGAGGFRTEAARARREEAERQRLAALRERVGAKAAPAGASFLEQQIAELESRLASGASAPAAHGLKRQLDTKRAQLQRQLRHAQMQQQQGACAEAASRTPAAPEPRGSGSEVDSSDFGPLGGPPQRRTAGGKRRIQGAAGGGALVLGAQLPPCGGDGPQLHGEPRTPLGGDPHMLALPPACPVTRMALGGQEEHLGDSFSGSSGGPARHSRRRPHAGAYGAAAAPWGNACNDCD
eukprot:TRINITY_DN9188_c0_g1_i1.p1 TRINITY_DN9188_c0_g1~~TRINITY_DN9188_c0_g1_i1.p1  ORF type:complete len:926 (+),score=259.86 TRINITY_DN9188_c0_g1_i1:101-2779(+)